MPIKTIVGTIEDFVLAKQGKKKDGTPWALYKGFIGGEKFQTFDPEYLKNMGAKKRFLYEEEDRSFTNNEGKLIEYLSKSLLPFKTAKDSEQDPAEGDMPVIEDPEPVGEEEPVSTADIEAEFINPEEKIMEALKGDDGWLQKIYKKLVEILIVLEK